MSRLCWSCGARTCCSDRFCDWCIPGPAIAEVNRSQGRKASNFRAATAPCTPSRPCTGIGDAECDLLYIVESCPMKRILRTACRDGVCCVLDFRRSSRPPQPSNSRSWPSIKEIQTQQAQIAENQAKIDAKLATVVEAVRVAQDLCQPGRPINEATDSSRSRDWRSAFATGTSESNNAAMVVVPAQAAAASGAGCWPARDSGVSAGLSLKFLQEIKAANDATLKAQAATAAALGRTGKGRRTS